MKDSFLTKAKLDRMKDDGTLAQDLGCFLLALPCFQDYGPFLDLSSGQSKALLSYYFPKYEELLKKAVEVGYYIQAKKGAAIYLEKRFFADNKATNHYWKSESLYPLADGLFISEELIISGSPKDGGPLPSFLSIWDGGFNFGRFGKGTLKRCKEGENKGKPQQDSLTLWREQCRHLLINENGNSNKESRIGNAELGIGNLESGIMESRIDNPLMPNEENPSSPSSCSSPVDLIEDDLPFDIEEEESPSLLAIENDEEQKRPLTNERQSFLNWWNALRDDRSRKSLIEKTRKESWDSCKAALPKQDKAIFDRLVEEIEDSLPF